MIYTTYLKEKIMSNRALFLIGNITYLCSVIVMGNLTKEIIPILLAAVCFCSGTLNGIAHERME